MNKYLFEKEFKKEDATSSDRKKDAAAFLKVLEDEEPTELAILGEAIEAAKKAFEDLLQDKYNIDPAYYRLSVEIEFRDSMFAENLGKLTYEDLS